jgi:hypothetical protein
MVDRNNRLEHDFEILIDKALKTEPDYQLPDNFAEQLTAKLGTQTFWKQSMQEFILYLGALLVIAGLAIATLLWMDHSFWQQLIAYFNQQYSLIIGIYVLLIFVLFVDRVLLKYFHFRINEKRHLM